MSAIARPLAVLAGLALAALTSPAQAAPPSEAQCIGAWPKTAKPSAAMTEGCIDVLLTHAYFGKPDAEALSLDPSPDSPLEVKLLTPELQAIKAHIAACAPKKGDEDDWRCTRVHEFVDGMISRKNAVSDQGGLESLLSALNKVLKGEALTAEDLESEGYARFTPLGLWKLRNAAYARHGFAFKKADLNTFFYGERPMLEAMDADDYAGILPLSKGEKAKVDLTPVDGANVRLIAKMEGKLTAAAKKRKK